MWNNPFSRSPEFPMRLSAGVPLHSTPACRPAPLQGLDGAREPRYGKLITQNMGGFGENDYFCAPFLKYHEKNDHPV